MEKKREPDGTRTRNPQIRSLMRYPLRHWPDIFARGRASLFVCNRQCGRLVNLWRIAREHPNTANDGQLSARVGLI